MAWEMAEGPGGSAANAAPAAGAAAFVGAVADDRLSQSLGWGVWGVLTTVGLGLWAARLERGRPADPVGR
ncbi:hypothetical protein [Streptomyces sp. TLI_146]|uniref:hypothetical protein n=1 Tax=Streptomyces sp. TLI_146 TaxID=1938858 RepID=UPI000CCB02C4|nr:hypothetical protein [Streptomyces sp. TLI_146]PKV89737.1 hypothetical protein BX283_7381 [Streptomyces sp. TLI_146]